MTRKKIIIDTDIGVDDAFAVAYALAHKDLELVGITTVFGNIPVEKATLNAQHFISLVNNDIPIVKGASKPIDGSPTPTGGEIVHGASGLGNYSVPFNFLSNTDKIISNNKADEFLAKTILDNPNEITIVPIGPLTNIAKLAKKYPEAIEKVQQISLMGAAFFTQGNVTPCAEANIFHDSVAAEIVFASNWKITALGLDVTEKIIISQEDLEPLLNNNTSTKATLIKQAFKFYSDFYHSFAGIQGCMMHDPCALIALTRPDLFHFQNGSIKVSTSGFSKGATFFKSEHRASPKLEWPDHSDHRIALDTNTKAVKEELLGMIEEFLKN